MSPWVHHFAVHRWPLKETCCPPVYAVDEFQAGAEHEPGLGDEVVGGGDCGGVAPANLAVNLVKSHGCCVVLEQMPLSLVFTHGRSRLTDQKVYRVSPCPVA